MRHQFLKRPEVWGVVIRVIVANELGLKMVLPLICAAGPESSLRLTSVSRPKRVCRAGFCRAGASGCYRCSVV